MCLMHHDPDAGGRLAAVPLTLLAMLALVGCASVPPRPDLRLAAPVFCAERFFSGRTEGEGLLRIGFSSGRAVHVHGRGHVDGDGTLVLDQAVERASRPTQQRQWRIRQVAPGHYSGTLTDAAGSISGAVEGNSLHLRFRLKGGLDAEQWIYLQPDGVTAINRMTVRKFGVPVASLRETIRHVG